MVGRGVVALLLLLVSCSSDGESGGSEPAPAAANGGEVAGTTPAPTTLVASCVPLSLNPSVMALCGVTSESVVPATEFQNSRTPGDSDLNMISWQRTDFAVDFPGELDSPMSLITYDTGLQTEVVVGLLCPTAGFIAAPPDTAGTIDPVDTVPLDCRAAYVGTLGADRSVTLTDAVDILPATDWRAGCYPESGAPATVAVRVLETGEVMEFSVSNGRLLAGSAPGVLCDIGG